MIDWIRIIINGCYQILTYSVNVGSGYSISIWNVLVFGVAGYLLLKLIFGIID